MDINQLNDLFKGRIKTAPESNSASGKIIVPYGPTKIGKTTTFCQSPDTLLVEALDESAKSLKESGAIRQDLPVISATDFHDVVDICKKLASDPNHGFKRVVIDGGSGMNSWSDEMAIANDFDGKRSEFTSWGRGEKTTAFYWQEFISALNELRNAGIWVFLICHKAVVSVKNPDGSDYYRSQPDLGKYVLSMVLKHADAILYFDYAIETQGGQKGTGAKAVGSARVMRCTPNASYEAGNRLNLPAMIELGDSPEEAAKAFYKAVKQGKRN